MAQPTPDPDPGQGAAPLDDPGLTLLPNTIYYPWVANDDDFGLGPADTSITIQNLEALDTYIYIYKGTGDGWALETTAYLAPWASKTFTADALNIESGTGVPVAVSSWRGGACVTELGPGGEFSAGRDVNGNETCSDFEVVVTLFDELPDAEQVDVCVANTADGLPAPYWDASVGAYVEWDDVEDLEANYAALGEFGGLNNDGDCSDAEGGSTAEPGIIGGVAKTAVDGETLPYTTTEDTSVSGYNALNGFELDRFDQWYLPIVQTNCGPGGCWDTVIRASNYSGTNAAIELRFFPSDDGSGSLNTGFQVNLSINGGETQSVVLSDYVPEGWVGSVHAYSDADIMLMADRFKVGYNMWLTNTGSSADFENIAQVAGGLGQYVLFAPDVRVDYFGWNTGINIANLVEEDNNVTVQYFNMFGNATGTQTQRLAPHGMTYFYDPSQLPQDNSSQNPEEDLNANVVGSALIWSDQPVAVAVDATKYPESTTELDAEVFQGTTYSATANVYNWQSVPLVQKGNPATGMGATSGINMMNPNAAAAQALVYWVNQSGFGADNFGTTALAIPGFANGFVYTLAQHNLPNGFYGAALVTSTYPIVATSANVDYQVQYDGSVIWNAFNPCGFYRTPGVFDCYLGDPFEPVAGGSVKKIFYDEFGEPVEGALAVIMNETAYQHFLGDEEFPGVPYVAEGYSDINGEVTWTNVPPGDYYLLADAQTQFLWNSQDLPIFEDAGDEPDHVFTLLAGDDLTFENELFYIPATKIVYTGIPGVEICLFGEADVEIGEGTVYGEDDILLDCAVADEEGDFTFTEVPQGWYWVIVNGGIENPADPAFGTIVHPADGPEFIEWGVTLENEITGEPLGVGSLYKEFDVGVYGGEQLALPWDDVAIGADIFCLTPVPGCAPATDEVQEFDLGDPTAGTFVIDFGAAGITGPISWDATEADIQTAVDTAIGVDNAVVSYVDGVITITFTGAYAGTAVPDFIVTGDPDFDGFVGTATEVTVGSEGLFANLGPDAFFPVDETTYAFELNSVPVGTYELCYAAELSVEDVGAAVNEVQTFDTADIVVGFPTEGSYVINIPVLPSGAGGVTTGAIGFDADVATIQAAVDAVVPAGEILVSATYDPEDPFGVASITFEYIGPNAGLDVEGVFSVADAGLLPPFNGAVGDAVVTQEGGELDVTVFWFGCEEFTIETDGQEVEIFNDIAEDGIVTGDIVVEVTGTTAGQTYEVCLLYGELFEVVFDCVEGVAGNDGSVFVTLSPDLLALVNALLEDEAGFQLDNIFRARVVDELTDEVTLSEPVEVDPLTDLPPQIVVAAPAP